MDSDGVSAPLKESGLFRFVSGMPEPRRSAANHPKWVCDCPICPSYGRSGKRKLTVSYTEHHEGYGPILLTACGSCHTDFGPSTYYSMLLTYAKLFKHEAEQYNDYYTELIGHPWEGEAGEMSSAPVLPEAESVEAWCVNLLEDPDFADALRYLTVERGLTPETIHKNRIGYRLSKHGFVFTIPIPDKAGTLVNVRERPWPDAGPGPKYRGLKDCGIQMYPMPMLGTYRIICEGEFDALIGRQHRLPTVTSTAGTSGWTGWIEHFSARVPIFIVFDPEGYETKAQPLAEKFRAAGHHDVWPINLGKDGPLGPRRGMRPKEDLTDWFVKYKRTAEALKALLWAERRRQK